MTAVERLTLIGLLLFVGARGAAARRALARGHGLLGPARLADDAVVVEGAERRLLAVTNPAEAAKNAAKDKEKWGELKGTRAQLFYDISKILDEAVVNVDDAAVHDPDSPLLRKSLYMLAAAAGRILPELAKLREGVTEEAEADQLDRALEMAREITDAAKERGVSEADMKAKAKPVKKDN